MSNWTITDGVDTVTIQYPTEWDDSQPPVMREVSTQGRPWSRVHWEGAGALRVNLNGVITGTVGQMRDAVRQLKDWATNGTIVELDTNGDDTDLDGDNYLLEQPDAPRMVAMLNHRWVSLTLVRRDED